MIKQKKIRINRKIISGIFLILILISSSYPLISSSVIQNKNKGSVNFDDSDRIQHNRSLKVNESGEITSREWDRKISFFDKNGNGINDNLDEKLFLKEKEKFQLNSGLKRSQNNPNPIEKRERESTSINKSEIPVIVQYPEKFSEQISTIFKSCQGEIQSIYNTAIQGFSGIISEAKLVNFSNYLNKKNLPFFIEEDSEVESNLYYTGRNMNLRPYVWNRLGYDGDEWSSIAIIDSGIDETHNFHYGYNNGSFDHKIVGWKDFVDTSTTTPYDENGHGTHVAGIAAGEGTGASTSDPNTYRFTSEFRFNGSGFDFEDGTFSFDLASFKILSDFNDIELIYQFDDFTKGNDDVNASAMIIYNNTIIHRYTSNTTDDWIYYPSSDVIDTSGKIGKYNLRLKVSFIDNDTNGNVSDPDMAFRSIIDYPFNPNKYGAGNIWKGVANDTHLVGVKALDKEGSGDISAILDAVEWVIVHKKQYNITVLSMSLGSSSTHNALNKAVNNAVKEGIVTVVAAGNDGPGIYNQVGSPGAAEQVITVAALNSQDNITYYSSRGGLYYHQRAIKPDIAAPGGSVKDLTLFSGDTNDNDAQGLYSDAFLNDMTSLQGTSMATPAVSGAANLLIEAMGGHKNWDYSHEQAKLVKALLLMTATETYPLLRESYNREYSPELNRGGKDYHEGYGRINIDMAIEAFTKNIEIGSTFSKNISSSFIDSFEAHGVARNLDLGADKAYKFHLSIPENADFDLYLYKKGASHLGEPIILASSKSPKTGEDEVIFYSPQNSGKYYLVAKAVSGQGIANISTSFIEDLAVSIDAPRNPDIHGYSNIDATVNYYSEQFYNEVYNINFTLTLDGDIINSTVIPVLTSGESYSISYDWNPGFPDQHELIAYTDYLDDEAYIENNRKIELINTRTYYFFDDFEEDLSKWERIEEVWHITGDSSGRPNSSYSPSHSLRYGNQFTGHYSREGTNYAVIESKSIDLTNAGSELYLEFHHWRNASYYDESKIWFYHTDEDNILRSDTLNVYDENIIPWKKDVYDISYAAGTDDAQIFFQFSISDTDDDSDYRGWLIDDVAIYGNLDDIPPKWIETPTDQTENEGSPFRYNVNATDPTGIAFYTISDTENFEVNDDGIITNKKALEEGTYNLEIRSYDSYYNYVSAKITITIQTQAIPGYEILFILSLLGVSAVVIFLRKKDNLTLKN